jgi:crotonobetainyl-CoA:carnitine CoA-transferase CaiB-like acyl-CoA transferase
MSQQEGKKIFRELVSTADVLIENLSPGAFDRLGLPLDELAAENDDLIIGSIKAFGSGPYEDRLGMDHPIESETGMSYMTGLEGRPLRVGFSVVDIISGTYQAFAAMTLMGQLPLSPDERVYSIGMFETASFMMSQAFAYAAIEQQTPPPLNLNFKRTVYDYFDTGDDKKVFLGLVSEAQWERFTEAFDMTDILDDPDLQDKEGRIKQRDYIHDRISKAFSEYTQDEIVEILRELRLPYGPWQTPYDLLDDEHLNSRNKLLHLAEDDGDIPLPHPPMEGAFFDYQSENVEVPGLGEHTEESLTALGYSKDEIATLREDGVIGDEDSPVLFRQ